MPRTPVPQDGSHAAGPMAGIRVVEAASFIFVPSATAILADLGADVIKVEAPGGDPMRRAAQRTSGGPGASPLGCLVEVANRGKRSIVLDLATAADRGRFDALVAGADVFATNFLPRVRTKLRLTREDIHALNPHCVYASGSGWGPDGPLRETAAFDMTSAWAQSGGADWFAGSAGGELPIQPFGFYDVQAGAHLAGAIGTALFQRERTGVAGDVDVSLLNVGLWSMQAFLGVAHLGEWGPQFDRHQPANPLLNWYLTADDRWILLSMSDSERWWEPFCATIGRPDMVSDPRFATPEGRGANAVACAAEIQQVFRTRALAGWQRAFDGFTGAWGPVLRPLEVAEHPQVVANAFLNDLGAGADPPYRAVAPPGQFGGRPTVPTGRAPFVGEHTEDVLRELRPTAS